MAWESMCEKRTGMCECNNYEGYDDKREGGEREKRYRVCVSCTTTHEHTKNVEGKKTTDVSSGTTIFLIDQPQQKPWTDNNNNNNNNNKYCSFYHSSTYTKTHFFSLLLLKRVMRESAKIKIASAIFHNNRKVGILHFVAFDIFSSPAN